MPFAMVTILGLVLEHSVDDTGQFMGCGGNGGRIVFAAHSAVKPTQSALATTRAVGHHSEGLDQPSLGSFGHRFS